MENLKHALHTSFIDRAYDSFEDKQVKILANGEMKIITQLRKELLRANEIFISVAFITESGVSLILNELKKLEEKGVRGRILTGSYLNFTQPKAIRKLMEFKNLEVRIYDEGALHAKGYFFKYDDSFSVILGSSNLTNTALTTNNEWNIFLQTKRDGKFTKDIALEFKDLWVNSKKAHTIIDEYEKTYNDEKIKAAKVRQLLRENKIEESNLKITPNSMQKEALNALTNLREKEKDKGLIISATGTGKTYLAAFDVKNYNPKKFLFIIHRENIARKAMETFQNIMPNKTMGLYTGTTKDNDVDFLFSTIQTLSRDNHLEKFSPDYFDYIAIDEVHHSGANSYLKILDYFKPKFLLGMTATPERTDDFNIFELFDYNIANEVRLYDALDHDLLTPFHYFGVSDYIDPETGETIMEKSNINSLTLDMRVDYILEKMKFYGYSGKTLHGLIFVSSVEEAINLSEKLNERDVRTKPLTGKDSEIQRLQAIRELEEGKLEYLITVDIFNEGIDIPCVNQVVLLRATESSIVYIQQLGRGLRLDPSKEFVTVLDFIGNYKKSFLNIVALSQNNKYNKEELNQFLLSSTDIVPGASSIVFDEISKDRIFEQIKKVNFSNKALIKHDFDLLKKKLNRLPLLSDFYQEEMISPTVLLKWKDNYNLVLNGLSKKDSLDLSEQEDNYLSFLCKEYTPSKRIHEMEVINVLIQRKNKPIEIEEINSIIEAKYRLKDQFANTENAVLHLGKGIFEKYSLRARYQPILDISSQKVSFESEFYQSYEKNNYFKLLIDDLVKFNLLHTIKEYPQSKTETFSLYKNYTRQEAYRLTNYDFHNAMLSGYPTASDDREQLIFITLDDSASFTSYDNVIHPDSTITWFSTNNRQVDFENPKPNKETKIALNLFEKIRVLVRRRNTENFYYVGDIEETIEVYNTKNERKQNIVKYLFSLKKEIPTKLREYLTVK